MLLVRRHGGYELENMGARFSGRGNWWSGKLAGIFGGRRRLEDRSKDSGSGGSDFGGIVSEDQPITAGRGEMMPAILDDLKKDGLDVLNFFKKLKDDVIKAKNIWTAINSPQTRAFVTTLAQDVLKVVNDADVAVADKGINFAADSQVFQDAKQLIADAKAGDGVIKTDLALLGITL